VLEIISALEFRELVEDSAAEFPEFIDGPFGSVAKQLLELRKGQLDRIQVWRVRGQVTQLGAGRFDGFANSSDLVAGEIVHHYDIANSQDWHKVLLDPGAE
jgi:hypothetical protein